MSHPYFKCEVRVDKVVRVPSWACEYISKGELVERHEHNTVRVHNDKYKGLLKLGESYTKPVGYYIPYSPSEAKKWNAL